MPKIKQVFEASMGVYGSPRVHAELVAEGVTAGRNKVARLMRLERLRGLPQAPFPGHNSARPDASGCEEPAEAELRGGGTELAMGLRHYLHLNKTGLALPGGRDGSLLPPDRGLVHEPTDGPAPRDRGVANGH